MKKKEPTKKQSGKKSSTVRLLVFALLAGGVCGYLFFRARNESPVLPEKETPAAGSESPAPRPKPVAAGDRLPAIPLTSLDGEALEFRLEEGAKKPVLLYLFSPTCSICSKTIPAWKEIAAEAESRSVEVVGISMMEPAPTTQYVNQHQLPWNVYCVAGMDSLRALRVTRVPMTLVLEGSGHVAMALNGQLSSEQMKAITDYLDGDR